MAYPLLYGAAASLLRKLDASYLKNIGIRGEDMEQWKETLTFLPSIVETDDFSQEGLIAISEFVYSIHDFLNGDKSSSHDIYVNWKKLANHLNKTKIKYGLDLQKRRENEKSQSLLSSLSSALLSKGSPDGKLDGLPAHLVPCLAYCALYPEGSTIVRETLVNHWMAQGFLGTSEAPALKQLEAGSSSVDLDLEDVGNCYFNELLHRWGVFVEPVFVFGGQQSSDQQAATVHSCKLDPLVHEAARRLASNEVVINPDFKQLRSAAATARYIAFHKEISGIQYKFDPLKPLYTCMCFTPQLNQVALDSAIYELRVLDLSGAQFEKMRSREVVSAKLRYLALSRNILLRNLDYRPSLNLQTLAIDGCDRLEIYNVTGHRSLRHLYYTSKIRSLEMSNPTLRILQVSHCPRLRSLSMEYKDAKNLRRLRIFECPQLVSLPHSEGLLSNVEELVIHNCGSLDLNSGESMDSLPRLRYMEIIGLPMLSGLPVGFQSARFLQYLMIADCMSLRSMDDVLQHLKSLQKLRIYRCRTMSITPTVFHSLTALHSLDIRNCPKITTTWTNNAAATGVAPFISHIPDIILDGQRPFYQKADSFEENDATIAKADSYVIPCDFPYFVLSSEKTAEFLKGMFNEELELLVLYGLCPGDFEFERDTLVQLWMAMGLFQGPLESSGNLRFDNLVDEHYVIKSRTDILTGISKYKINVEKFNTLSDRVKSNDTYTMTEDTFKSRHVSVVGKIVDHATLFKAMEGITELKTVLLIRDYGSSLKQIPSTFFKTHRFMQALDLSGSHISELPSSIGHLTQLCFLNLSFTLIQRLPESIDHLRELQTLKLKGCEHLHTLPKGMNQLTSLRHLDFDVLGQLTSMPQGIGMLTKLHTLSAFIVSKEDGCSLRELKNLNELGGSFCISGLEYASPIDSASACMQDKKHMTRLHLKWNDSISYDRSARQNAQSTINYLLPGSVLEELQISYFPGIALPHWMRSQDYDQLVSVTLLQCEILTFVAPSMLANLKYLNIIDMNGVAEIIVPIALDKRFPNLETLTIDGMNKLQTWKGVESSNDLPRLWNLSVKHCPKLTQLHFLPLLRSLTYLEISHCKSFESLPSDPLPTSLETLMINQCRLLKTRCSKGGEDWEKIKHVPNIWIDMKGIGYANEDTGSDYPDDSDEDLDYSYDDSDETMTP